MGREDGQSQSTKAHHGACFGHHFTELNHQPTERFDILDVAEGLVMPAQVVQADAASGPPDARRDGGELEGGIGRGAATPLLMLALLRSRSIGAALMGAAGGLFFTAGEVGGVLGPALTGMLADATGGFGVGLLLLAGVSVALALLTLTLRAAARDASRAPVAM